LHWEVPVEKLRPLVPPALSIDTFAGRAFVGLVPFTMHAVRVGPLPFRDFLETNLRTYVHAEGVPGVWFLSLDAEDLIAVWGGRTFYRLPYYRARMRRQERNGATDYVLRRDEGDATLEVCWSAVEGQSHPATPGSLEYFLTERYALYGPSSRGVYRVRVHHRPWPLRRARIDRLATSLLVAAGLDHASTPIDLALESAEGVEVEVFARESV
jgi:uncharacterized protein YqjF (DUF2071 family)